MFREGHDVENDPFRGGYTHRLLSAGQLSLELVDDRGDGPDGPLGTVGLRFDVQHRAVLCLGDREVGCSPVVDDAPAKRVGRTGIGQNLSGDIDGPAEVRVRVTGGRISS